MGHPVPGGDRSSKKNEHPKIWMTLDDLGSPWMTLDDFGWPSQTDWKTILKKRRLVRVMLSTATSFEQFKEILQRSVFWNCEIFKRVICINRVFCSEFRIFESSTETTSRYLCRVLYSEESILLHCSMRLLFISFSMSPTRIVDTKLALRHQWSSCEILEFNIVQPNLYGA